MVTAERESAKSALDRALSGLDPENRVTEEKIASFVEVIQDNFINGAVALPRARSISTNLRSGSVAETEWLKGL